MLMTSMNAGRLCCIRSLVRVTVGGACCVVGLRWWASFYYSHGLLLASCLGFCSPLHAHPLCLQRALLAGVKCHTVIDCENTSASLFLCLCPIDLSSSCFVVPELVKKAQRREYTLREKQTDCVGGLAFIVRECLRWFPALVSGFLL